jgi:hypothetical protein
MEKHRFENEFVQHIEEIFKTKYNFEDNLENLHDLLETNKITQQDKEYHTQIQTWETDRHSRFIKDFHEYVDTVKSFESTYKQFINTYIRPLYPNEKKLIIQKTPNIRISFPNASALGKDPNDPENMIGLHKDSDFGHSIYEMNYIIPITKMFSSNSIYYENETTGFSNLDLETNEFCEIYLNQINHCNKKNETGKTRISFDIRIISESKYMENYESFKNTKFDIHEPNPYYITY